MVFMLCRWCRALWRHALTVSWFRVDDDDSFIHVYLVPPHMKNKIVLSPVHGVTLCARVPCVGVAASDVPV